MRLRFGRAGLIALLFAASARAQDASGRITGTVVDAEGQAPMPNAIVTVVGTRLSALTRADGKYFLGRVPAGSQKIRVTRLGYAPKEQTVSVEANAEVTADFSLIVTAIPLEAAVVVGYGSVRRGDLTGSVASITPDAASVPTQSLEQVLVGKVPGVIVTKWSMACGLSGFGETDANVPAASQLALKIFATTFPRICPPEMRSASSVNVTVVVPFGSAANNGSTTVFEKQILSSLT